MTGWMQINCRTLVWKTVKMGGEWYSTLHTSAAFRRNIENLPVLRLVYVLFAFFWQPSPFAQASAFVICPPNLRLSSGYTNNLKDLTKFSVRLPHLKTPISVQTPTHDPPLPEKYQSREQMLPTSLEPSSLFKNACTDTNIDERLVEQQHTSKTRAQHVTQFAADLDFTQID